MSNKVLLVSMPLGELSPPSLGPCLLKPALARVGVECDIRYFGLEFFAKYFANQEHGDRTYKYLLMASSLFFLGEWIFAAHLFPDVGPPPLPRIASHPGSKFHGRQQEIERSVEFTLSLRPLIPTFMAECFASIRWTDYAIVGFTSCFNQNLASMALAAEIKKHHPEVLTVVGGANADGPMGSALLKAFPQIDYVFKGEADLTFPTFVQAVLGGEPVPPLPGVEGRDGHVGEKHVDDSAAIIRSMDDLPYPDFDDFRAQASALGLHDGIDLEMPVEASRGCWWGEKHHCTFCGLNREGMTFRSKSATRLLDELTFLRERYSSSRFSFTDNILDFQYFKDFLPESVRRGLKLDLFFEVKANINLRKMELLRDAGVTSIQPGIESLSTHILRLMRKGTSFVQNVECLKNCRTCGVMPIWAHLYGFPGESLDDYQAIADVIPSLHHLVPPRSLNPVIVQRFAPFFDSPELLGIANIRPHPAYRAIYPFADDLVRDLAYYFHDDRPYPAGVREFIGGPLSAAIGAWRASYARGAALDWVPGPEGSAVIDTRGAESIVWQLDHFETAVLRLLDRPTSLSSALADVSKIWSSLGHEDATCDYLARNTGPDKQAAGRQRLDALRADGIAFRPMQVARSPIQTADARFQQCIEAFVTRRLIVREGATVLGLPIVPLSAQQAAAEPRRLITLSPA